MRSTERAQNDVERNLPEKIGCVRDGGRDGVGCEVGETGAGLGQGGKSFVEANRS